VVNAECHFVGKAEPLTGGREFLESLVTAVNSYAQESLSRVPRPASHNEKPPLVQLKKGPAEHLHRLTIQPSTVTDAVRNGGNGGQASAISERHPEMPEVVPTSGASPTQIDLTTVQMFDLVEACDQFQADSRTVPDISLHLSPISKRNVAAGSPIAKRAAPAAVGVTSLAVCAIALYFIPVPRVNPPAPSSKSQVTSHKSQVKKQVTSEEGTKSQVKKQVTNHKSPVKK
jgi:hypothetical protein